MFAEERVAPRTVTEALLCPRYLDYSVTDPDYYEYKTATVVVGTSAMTINTNELSKPERIKPEENETSK